eukprot:COSAG05_NODE_1079_length_5951_cov_17.759911_8_plen_203_part_01
MLPFAASKPGRASCARRRHERLYLQWQWHHWCGSRPPPPHPPHRPDAMVPRPVRFALLAVALLRPVSGYLQPTGDSLTTAHTGVWGRTHGDLTANAIMLMEVDGHGHVAQQFTGPADRAALLDGLRQADMGGGEFIVQLYGSAGRAPRNSFSHFYNPLTKEGFVFPIPSTNGLTLSPDPNLMIRARWEVSIMLGPFPSAVDMI